MGRRFIFYLKKGILNDILKETRPLVGGRGRQFKMEGDMERRRKQIVELINEKGQVGFAQLVKSFPDVSEMTLRNDLKFLDANRQIIRIHGGARSLDTVIDIDDPLHKRISKNNEKKQEIAKKAVRLIHPRGAIFLDSGSTMIELAKIFPDERCKIFTVGVPCTMELARLKSVDVHVFGGRLKRESLSISGVKTLQEIENVNFNLAIIGVTGYCRGKGFCCSSEERCEINRAVMRRAEKVMVLMDSQKVGKSDTYILADSQDIDILIPDHDLDREIQEDLEQKGVEVY